MKSSQIVRLPVTYPPSPMSALRNLAFRLKRLPTPAVGILKKSSLQTKFLLQNTHVIPPWVGSLNVFCFPPFNVPARHSFNKVLQRFISTSWEHHYVRRLSATHWWHTGHCDAYAAKNNYTSLDMKNTRCHNTGRDLVHSVLVLDYSGHLTPTPF